MLSGAGISSAFEGKDLLQPSRHQHNTRVHRVYHVQTILVEANALFRDGLARILGETRFRIAAPVSHLADIPARTQLEPKLILLGANDRPELSAQEVDACAARYPSAKRVFLNHYLSKDDLLTAIRRGVNGCLSKATTTQAFLTSLDLVMLGEPVFCCPMLPIVSCPREINHQEQQIDADAMRKASIHDPVFHQLSARELNTLHCLVQGESNKVIARRFDITEATVKVHIKAILRKIRVANRTQAAIWAIKHFQLST
jgi:two-component system, NarL family, nitrate/nitrite response regulator NarL